MSLSPEDDLLQSLTSGELFSSHPLAESDPFTPLLARYLPVQARPPRKDGQARPGEDSSSLIANQRWQALANRMAEEILVRQGTQNNTLQDIEAVLSRWTVRLQCLRRLQRLQGLASEANALFSSLPQLYTLPLHTGQQQSEAIFETYIPFDLILLQAVLPAYLRGDQFIVLRHLQEIAYGCKLEYRRTREVHWITKLHTTGIAMVNVLYALGETRQAVDLLSSLVEQNKRQDVQLLSALGRLAMDIGDMRTADSVIVELKSLDEGSDEYKSLRIAKLLCDGDWNQAEQTARAWSNSTRGSSTLAKANLAACCMYSERVQEGMEILESLARTEPDKFYNSETNISNLISLQELQAGDQIANKLDLLKECSRYASETLSLDCLRL